MNIATFVCNNNVFINVEYIKGYAFKNVQAQAIYVFLPVLCANFAALQDKCAHFFRFKCLWPHNSIA